eukprot:1335937-Rhodomonas_salina.1
MAERGCELRAEVDAERVRETERQSGGETGAVASRTLRAEPDAEMRSEGVPRRHLLASGPRHALPETVRSDDSYRSQDSESGPSHYQSRHGHGEHRLIGSEGES